MTSLVVGMVLIVVIALVVLAVAAQDEPDDWTKNRPGREDPDEGNLDDLLH